MPQAAVLKPSQYRHILRVTRATSRDPERDILVLLLGIHTGMRVSEIAQVDVSDVLFPSGAIRPEVSLQAHVIVFVKWTANFLCFGVRIGGSQASILFRTKMDAIKSKCPSARQVWA